jgi:predicted phage replisome organizer
LSKARNYRKPGDTESDRTVNKPKRKRKVARKPTKVKLATTSKGIFILPKIKDKCHKRGNEKKGQRTMSKQDNRKYYWIKLKKDFFDLEAIDFLLAQKNGADYIVIYQMLCLITMNEGGALTKKIGEIIMPFDIQKIQRETKYFNIDTIRIALELFKKLGLIYENEGDNTLKITDIETMIGSETKWAKLKRNQRERQIAEVKESDGKPSQEKKIIDFVEIAKAKWI